MPSARTPREPAPAAGHRAARAGVAARRARASGRHRAGAALEREPRRRAEAGRPARAHAGGVHPPAPRAPGHPAHGGPHADAGGDGEHRRRLDAPGGDRARHGGALRPRAGGSEPRPRAAGPAAVAMRLPAPVVGVARWLFALVVPAVALALSLVMQPLIDQVPSPPFVAGVLLVAWVSGFKPALLTVLASAAVLDYYFVPLGVFSLDPREVVWMSLFVGTNLVIAWLVANRAQSRARVVRSAEHLRPVTASPTGRTPSAMD